MPCPHCAPGGAATTGSARIGGDAVTANADTATDAVTARGISTARGTPPMSSRGLTYSPFRRTPTCTHPEPQCPPDAVTPSGSPAATDCPTVTDASTGSMLERYPSPCSTATSGLAPTTPANTTVPAIIASTGLPGAAARSAPRCPAAYRVAGARYSAVTETGSATGHRQPVRAATSADPVPAAAAGPANTGVTARTAGRSNATANASSAATRPRTAPDAALAAPTAGTSPPRRRDDRRRHNHHHRRKPFIRTTLGGIRRPERNTTTIVDEPCQDRSCGEVDTHAPSPGTIGTKESEMTSTDPGSGSTPAKAPGKATSSPGAADDHETSKRLRRKVIALSVAAALGGFLFGFDSSVINGAVKAIDEDFALGDLPLLSGFVVAVALLGCAVGAYFAGRIADRIGRIPVMLIGAGLFLISSIGSGFAFAVWDLIAWRFIGGLGIGIASVIAPAYIAEIAPKAVRGALASLQQLAITLGIFAALLSDTLLQGAAGGANEPLWFGQDAWRWMFIACAVPAIVYGLLAWRLPESPRYLAGKGKREDAHDVLASVMPANEVDNALKEIEDGIKFDKENARTASLRGKMFGLLPVVWVGILLSMFQQLVGINVIFYYSTSLWSSVGFDTTNSGTSFTISVVTSIINVAVTFVAIFFVDKIGRRPLLLTGSAGMVVSLGLMAIAFCAGRGDGWRHSAAARCLGPAGPRGREPLRHLLRRHLGPDRLGAARRDLPQPDPRQGARHRRRGAVAHQFRHHRDLPGAVQLLPGLHLRALHLLRPGELLLRVLRGARDEGALAGEHGRPQGGARPGRSRREGRAARAHLVRTSSSSLVTGPRPVTRMV